MEYIAYILVFVTLVFLTAVAFYFTQEKDSWGKRPMSFRQTLRRVLNNPCNNPVFYFLYY